MAGFHVKFKDKASMKWFKSRDFDNKEDMLAHYWDTIRANACEVEFATPGQTKTVPQKGKVKEGYDKTPDSLMGFRKNGQNKGFDSQNYPHTQHVEVHMDDDKFTDAVKGLNKTHAMERAKRNWPDAKAIKPITAPVTTENVNEGSLKDPMKRVLRTSGKEEIKKGEEKATSKRVADVMSNPPNKKRSYNFYRKSDVKAITAHKMAKKVEGN